MHSLDDLAHALGIQELETRRDQRLSTVPHPGFVKRFGDLALVSQATNSGKRS
jgi:hypothetical protein